MMPLAVCAPETVPLPPHEGPLPAPIRFELLTVMRGLAVVGILMFHVNALFIPFGNLIHTGILYLHLGLPVFFIISGFCMMASMAQFRQQGFSSLAFMRHRLSRVYPPLWLALVLAVLQPPLKNLCLGLKDPFAPEFLPYAKLSAAEWLSFVTLLRIYFSHGRELIDGFRPVNPVYWSLAIEVQFYAIVYLIMAYPRFSRMVVWSVTLTGVAASFITKSYNTGSFLPYWPSFALGMGLYACIQRGLTPHRLLHPRIAAFSPVLALGLLWFYLYRVGYMIGDRPQIFCSLITLCLWTLYPLDARLARLQQHPVRPVAWAARLLFTIGAISYSIYLLHIPMVDLFDTILSHFMTRSIGYTLLLLPLTCLCCYPFYLYCERPFINAGKPRKKPRLPAAPAPEGTAASC